MAPGGVRSSRRRGTAPASRPSESTSALTTTPNPLAAFDETTFWGPVKFGSTGQIVSLEPPVFQIQNGKPTVVHPAAIRQGELRLGVK